MSHRIRFSEFDVSSDGWVRCAVTRDTEQELAIRLPYAFTPAPDLLACMATSLCGTDFDLVEIDLPIGDGLAAVIQDCTHADLAHRPGTDVNRRPGTSTALHFSGGFDSLAARELLPDAHLVSLDFGGRFARERRFFSRFDPLIFETNLVDIGLNRLSWQFMGIGALLLRDELDLGAQAFGSAMSASHSLFRQGPVEQGAEIPVAQALGLSTVKPVVGLSEISTMSLVAATDPSILVDALFSVAGPTEDKYRRKHLMLEAVCTRLGLPLQLPEAPTSTPAITWGTQWVTDVSSLQVAQILGVDRVSASYADGLPDRVLSAIDGLDLGFMDRINPHPYAGVPTALLADWYRHLIGAGILPFLRKDWAAADAAVELLQP